MSTTPSFQSGDRLRVEYVNAEHEFKALDEIQVVAASAAQLTLGVPESMGPLEAGNPLKLIKFAEQRRYEAVVHVLSPLEAGIGQLVVSLPERVRNLPRRDYFRCKTHLAVQVEDAGPGHFRDMSASGGTLAFKEPQDLAQGQIVCLEFNLPDQRDPVRLEAEIVRMGGSPERPRAAVRFLPLSKRLTEALLHYLHQVELDSRAWLRP